MKTYEPICGENITETSQRMVEMANARKRKVEATFNSVLLRAHPRQLPVDIEQFFHRSMKRASDQYARSPAGKEQARALEENQRVIAEAQAKGPVSFSIRDQAAWKKWSDANAEGYGAAILRYAALWANLMEQAMARGSTLADIADKESHEADVEGITGFMHGAAVQVLAETWSEGEALRRWHNLKTQIGREGEKANETGGTLNPALLTIG
jgi:hypothetical protein